MSTCLSSQFFSFLTLMLHAGMARIESIEAAEASGHADWLRGEIAAVIGEPLLERLLQGSRRHAARRTDEMEAARRLLALGTLPTGVFCASDLLAVGLVNELLRSGVKVPGEVSVVGYHDLHAPIGFRAFDGGLWGRRRGGPAGQRHAEPH